MLGVFSKKITQKILNEIFFCNKNVIFGFCIACCIIHIKYYVYQQPTLLRLCIARGSIKLLNIILGILCF